jgi:hypothetical protein
VHRRGAGFLERGHLLVELVGFPRSQYHRRSGSQAAREFKADLAAAAKDQYRTCARVVHGCDYYLR